MGQEHTSKDVAGCSGNQSIAYSFVPFLAIVLIGILLRVAYYSYDASLWGDEAALAINLLNRTPRELLDPLDHNQHAPILYLMAERGLVEVFGLSERGLRLPSLVASVISLILFCVFIKKTCEQRTAMIALALFSLCPMLIRYAGELKPYSWDVCGSTLICLLGINASETVGSTRKLIVFAAVGALLIWASFPIVFVLCGVGGAWIMNECWNGAYWNALKLSVVASVWSASFCIYFFFFSHHSSENQDLLVFWQYYFAPLPPTSLWECRRIVELALQPFGSVLGFLGVGLPALLFLMGAIVIARRSPLVVWQFTLPIAITFVASGLQKYPFSGRLILFLIPLYLVPIAAGASAILGCVQGRLSQWGMYGILFLGPMLGTNDILKSPERSGVRDVLVVLHKRALPGDVVYVYYKAGLSFDLYQDKLGRDDVGVIHGSRSIREDERYKTDLDQFKSHRRVWLLFSEAHRFFADEEKLMLSEAVQRGTIVDEVHVATTTAYLWELGSSSAKPTSHP